MASRYVCMDCNSENLIIPDSPQFFDTVICEDCGAEYPYGKLRSSMETGQFEALPVCGVQELNE